VAIGETLAEARHQAGLTVAEVSERTRIRETIIRGIEHDDYSACGGDFYARGNIRSIAKVVGTDAEPLIREYDTDRRAPGALSTVSLDELLATSADAPRERPSVSAVRGAAAARAPARGRVSPPVVRERVARAYPPPGRRVNWAVVLGLALVLVLGFGVYRLLSGSPHAGAPPSEAGKQAAAQQHAQQSGPAPTASHAAAPSPAPPAARTLTPVSARAFGPAGGDNPQRARFAIDRSHASGWRSNWYTSAHFGNLYRGTGLLLNMGRTVAISRVRINLGRVSGAAFQLRVGTRPSMAHLRTVARAGDAGGVVGLRLAAPAHGRYVLIWFTSLPPDQSGTFQVSVYSLRLEGPA
jgi:transcriptional regulator with XRE-family HTH domain